MNRKKMIEVNIANCHELVDPVNLRALYHLSHGELCARDLAERTGYSYPMLHKRLIRLRNLGFVSSRSEGRVAYFRSNIHTFYFRYDGDKLTLYIDEDLELKTEVC